MRLTSHLDLLRKTNHLSRPEEHRPIKRVVKDAHPVEGIPEIFPCLDEDSPIGDECDSVANAPADVDLLRGIDG